MPIVTKTFNYTGQFQTAELPSGTTAITMHLWGGAGGSGGADSQGDGADGGAGHYVTVTNLDVTAYAGAKLIGVAVGGGAESGGMGGEAPGGKNGQSLTGYSGGQGGSSGPVGSSGSGGGGGGSTTVTLFESGQAADTIKLAIAGGGGGGGGTGASSRGGIGINTNSATLNTPGSLGENGAGHSGDGGGGGAGGGGTDGGKGGSGATGDAGGFGGHSGSNTVPAGGSEDNGSGLDPAGTGSAYYTSGIAKGGRAGLAGGAGKAVLLFTIPSESKVKVGGAWKSFDSIRYKVSGVWKHVNSGFYKVGGVWKAIFTTDILFNGNSAAFGNPSGGTTSGTEGSGGIPTVSNIPPQGGGGGGGGFVAPAARSFHRHNPHTTTGYSRADQDSGQGGPGKGVICTMMNDTYGFGTFRNKIWHKFWIDNGSNGKKGSTEDYRIEKGYHAIFIPLVRIAKKDGNLAFAIRKILEHMGRHVTADFYGEMRNKKRDNLGRVYRAVFEPICWGVGKFKKKRTNLHRLKQSINKDKE